MGCVRPPAIAEDICGFSTNASMIQWWIVATLHWRPPTNDTRRTIVIRRSKVQQMRPIREMNKMLRRKGVLVLMVDTKAEWSCLPTASRKSAIFFRAGNCLPRLLISPVPALPATCQAKPTQPTCGGHSQRQCRSSIWRTVVILGNLATNTSFHQNYVKVII
jgi:hypothetical protein